MSDARQHEAVRNTLALIRSMLAGLTPEQRDDVLINLGFDQAATHAEVVEWREHNRQRMEEVWEARELLQAGPNETLPQAIKVLQARLLGCREGNEQLRDKVGKQMMLRINGKIIRCEACQANVFTMTGEKKWQCNGCQAQYQGE